jgi:hypothetical protein
MLEIKNEDIFFEEDNSPEATDRKIIQTNIDHLNGLKAALDHNALNHRELETNVKILVEAAPTKILKRVLKMLIKDDLQDQRRKMENL